MEKANVLSSIIDWDKPVKLLMMPENLLNMAEITAEESLEIIRAADGFFSAITKYIVG